jgi:hypothetical protein
MVIEEMYDNVSSALHQSKMFILMEFKNYADLMGCCGIFGSAKQGCI